MEFSEFLVGQVELDDVFYAIFADLHRYGGEAVFDAVGAIEVYGNRQHFVLVVIDRANQFRSGRGDAKFGAAFGGVFDVAFAVNLIEDHVLRVHVIELRLFGEEFIDGFPGYGHMAPGDHAGVAVFAQEVGGQGAAVDFQLVRELVLQARGVERGAGADDFMFRIVQLVLDVFRDDVAGIGNRNDDAVESGFLDERQKFLGGSDAAVHHVQARLSRQAGLAGCIDHDVCIFHIVDGAGIGFKMVRLIAHSVHEVHGFAYGFFVVYIIKYHFISQTLDSQLQPQMRAYIARTDDSHFSCFDCHILPHSFAANIGNI